VLGAGRERHVDEEPQADSCLAWPPCHVRACVSAGCHRGNWQAPHTRGRQGLARGLALGVRSRFYGSRRIFVTRWRLRHARAYHGLSTPRRMIFAPIGPNIFLPLQFVCTSFFLPSALRMCFSEIVGSVRSIWGVVHNISPLCASCLPVFDCIQERPDAHASDRCDFAHLAKLEPAIRTRFLPPAKLEPPIRTRSSPRSILTVSRRLNTIHLLTSMSSTRVGHSRKGRGISYGDAAARRPAARAAVDARRSASW